MGTFKEKAKQIYLFVSTIRWAVPLVTTLSALLTVFIAIWLGDRFTLDITIAAIADKEITFSELLALAPFLIAAFPLPYYIARVLWKVISDPTNRTWTLIHKYNPWIVTISLVGIILSFCGILIVSASLWKRYQYLNLVYPTVTALQPENAKLPNPIDLASAFALYPERKEVPVLLVRSSRIFAHGDNWLKFIEFQTLFADQIWKLMDKDVLCNANGQYHDPVRFVALVTMEAGVVLQDGKQVYDDKTIKAADRSLDLLEHCNGGRIERLILKMRIQDYVNTLNMEQNESTNTSQFYSIDNILKKIEEGIDALPPEINLNLYRTHAYQEYLDFAAYRTIKKIALAPNSNALLCEELNDAPEDIKVIIRQYRKLLSLRSETGQHGEISWYTSPGKLNLYRLFMAVGGFSNSINEEFVETVKLIPCLDSRVNKLLHSPEFEPFQKPDAWFRATPLDKTLKGAKLKTAFYQWMTTGWDI